MRYGDVSGHMDRCSCRPAGDDVPSLETFPVSEIDDEALDQAAVTTYDFEYGGSLLDLSGPAAGDIGLTSAAAV